MNKFKEQKKERFTFTLKPNHVALAKKLVENKKFKSLSSLVEISIENTIRDNCFVCEDCEKIITLTNKSSTPNICLICSRKRNNVFLCKNCKDLGDIAEDLSDIPETCKNCAITQKAMNKNKCLQCGGVDPQKKYWAICKKCWKKNEEEREKKSKEHLIKMEGSKKK